jgi:hypothetical protein
MGFVIAQGSVYTPDTARSPLFRVTTINGASVRAESVGECGRSNNNSEPPVPTVTNEPTIPDVVGDVVKPGGSGSGTTTTGCRTYCEGTRYAMSCYYGRPVRRRCWTNKCHNGVCDVSAPGTGTGTGNAGGGTYVPPPPAHTPTPTPAYTPTPAHTPTPTPTPVSVPMPDESNGRFGTVRGSISACQPTSQGASYITRGSPGYTCSRHYRLRADHMQCIMAGQTNRFACTEPLRQTMRRWCIDDDPAEIAAFVAHTIHETAAYKTFAQPRDNGRGAMHIIGEHPGTNNNVRVAMSYFQKKYKVPSDPTGEILQTVEFAFESAAWWWRKGTSVCGLCPRTDLGNLDYSGSSSVSAARKAFDRSTACIFGRGSGAQDATRQQLVNLVRHCLGVEPAKLFNIGTMYWDQWQGWRIPDTPRPTIQTDLLMVTDPEDDTIVAQAEYPPRPAPMECEGEC